MMRERGLILSVFLLAMAFGSARAQNDSGKGRIELPEGLVVRPHAYAHLEAGQIVKGTLSYANVADLNVTSYTIDHIYTEDAVVELGLDAIYHDRLKLVFSLDGKLYFSYPVYLLHDRYTKNVRQDLSFGDVFAQYHLGEAAAPLALGQIGYFCFKYNPDVRNLGEYLFRTGTYPIWFGMGFDFPKARLLGFHLEDNFFESLKTDVLFTSSTIFPAMNWSLAALANYDVARLHFVNIGAGVDFADLLDIYTDHFLSSGQGDPTTPKADINGHFIDANGDTSYYTFKGTKLMARISIDPKVFIPWKGFGENDLKLYAEADMIGINTYPDSASLGSGPLTLMAPSYNKLSEKMPVAFGFNVPTFKILDVLNVEGEWFGANYYNDPTMLVNGGSAPLPTLNTDTANAPKKSKVKWSVYAKKSFFNGHLAITGQIANDHVRLPCADYDKEYWNELLVTQDDWWWILKTSWMF